MKGNSIEDIIEEKYTRYLNFETDILELTIEEAIFILEKDKKNHYVEELLQEAYKVILSDYKRVLKENEELKAKAEIRLYISGMRNGKELLQKTLANYNDLSIKALKLQSITSYTIDDLIDLFLKGYTLQKDYIPTSLVKEKIEELNKKEQELQNSISDEEREEYSDANISFALMDIEVRRSVLQDLLGEE